MRSVHARLWWRCARICMARHGLDLENSATNPAHSTPQFGFKIQLQFGPPGRPHMYVVKPRTRGGAVAFTTFIYSRMETAGLS
jgi:hypothetical protein